MSATYIRVNGSGNAWPVLLGADHPYYLRTNADELSNASYSIIQCSGKEYSLNHIDWHILVDAGNNIASYLLRNENRIPEAIVLTHAHIDHTIGVDWIAHSYHYLNNKKYPVYATHACFKSLIQSLPFLESITEWKELLAGETITIREAKDLKLTPLPVFHGEKGNGAVMLVFEKAGKKAVFTGDMLAPLLRKKDYEFIKDSQLVFMDSNNRFPNPACNHESIVPYSPVPGYTAINEWLKDKNLSYFTFPHALSYKHNKLTSYFNEFESDFSDPKQLTFSIFDFLKKCPIPSVALTHYSGYEDKLNYYQDQLSRKELEKWVKDEAKQNDLNCVFKAVHTGDLFKLN